jgi:hypothetical protein
MICANVRRLQRGAMDQLLATDGLLRWLWICMYAAAFAVVTIYIWLGLCHLFISTEAVVSLSTATVMHYGISRSGGIQFHTVLACIQQLTAVSLRTW